MKRYIVITIFIVLSCSEVFTFEKVGTTSFQFLKVLPGARGAAMGYSVGTIVNNSEALFYNPAGICRVNNLDASVNYIDWFLDVIHYAFSGVYNLSGIGAFGLSMIYADYGTIEETKVENLGFIGTEYNPGLTGISYHPNAMAIGLSYAKDLTDKLSFGITAKYIRENLIYNKAGALAFDGGLIFNTGFRSIKIQTTIRHFGPEVKYIEKSYPLPQTFTIGISANLFAENEALLSDIQDQKLTLAYEMIQPRDYDQQHNVGLEYGYKNLIYLRGGYQFHGDQETYSAGFGVNYENVRVDYSYNKYGSYLDSVHRLTIGFQLNK